MRTDTRQRPTFRTAEVLRMAGISHRQLQYWSVNGYLGTVIAQGSGNWRRWTTEDAAAVLVVAKVSAWQGTTFKTAGSDTSFGTRSARAARAVRHLWREGNTQSHSLVIMGDEVRVVGRSALLAAVMSEPSVLTLHLSAILRPLVDALAEAERGEAVA